MHVPKWCHTPKSDMWIKSYKAWKLRMISIQNKLHPLFSWELSFRLTIRFRFLFKAFIYNWGILQLLGTCRVYVLIKELHPTLHLQSACNIEMLDDFRNDWSRYSRFSSSVWSSPNIIIYGLIQFCS
jgi:hypothetical protein